MAVANSRSSPLASPRLGAARRQAPAAGEQQERCELCGQPIETGHRHLLDLHARELCACRACTILFDRGAAGGSHYRLVPDRRVALDRLALSDATWERLRIPVEIAFFYRSSAAKRVLAFYPSPIGATESRLELDVWEELQRSDPLLSTMQDDVEALLVNRTRGARRQWIVPIEDCYRLVAVIRTSWRGFTGGKQAWLAIDGFFEDLEHKASND